MRNTEMRSAGRRSSLALLLGLCLALGPAISLYGQENGDAKAVPAENAAGEGAADADVEPPSSNFLVYIFRASPTFFVVMLGVSAWLGMLVVNGLLRLQLPNFIPPPLLARVDGLLTEQKYKEAYEAVRTDPSLFGRAVSAGVERLSHGFDRGMDALITVSEDGKMELQHRISYIATIGALGPLIGLLGTVLGMIEAFQRIAKGGQPKPAEIADAIGLALVSTLEGLVVALPAIFFFALFRDKIARLIFEVESVGESYLWRFAAALKK